MDYKKAFWEEIEGVKHLRIHIPNHIAPDKQREIAHREAKRLSKTGQTSLICDAQPLFNTTEYLVRMI